MITINAFTASALFIYFVILAYALYKSRDASDDFKKYSLSDERFPTYMIAIAMAVTMVGPADALALSQNGYKYGLIWAMFPIGAALAQFISAKFFVRKIRNEFIGLKTVGDIFVVKCCKSSAVAVGFVTIIQAIAFSGVLILAGGQILESFLGVQKEIGMIITALLVGGYTSIGGMKAVMKTDLIQGIFMGIMMLLLIVSCGFLISNGNGISDGIFCKADFSKEYDIRLIASLFLGYLLGELLLPAYCVRAMI